MTLNPHESSTFAAYCSPSENVLGGGFEMSNYWTMQMADVAVVMNAPDFDNSWRVRLLNTGGSPINFYLEVYAVCVIAP